MRGLHLSVTLRQGPHAQRISANQGLHRRRKKSLENILEKVASNSGPLLGSRPQGVTPPPGPSPPDERSQVTYMQSGVVTLAQRHNTRLAFPSMALSKGCKIREY